MLQVTTETADRLIAAADAAVGAGDLARAELLARQVIAMQPGSALAHHRLGLSFAHRGREAEALESFARAAALAPADADMRSDLGTALFGLGRMGEAAQVFQACVQMAPGHYKARVGLAEIYKKESRLSEALVQFQELLHYQPDNGDLWLEVGRVQRAMSRLSESVAALERAAAVKPNHYEAYHDLGITLELLDRHNDAIAAFQKCLALYPTHVGAHNNMATVFKQMGRLSEAAAEYRKGLACNTESVATLNNLGSVLISMGQCEEAAAAYERALAIDPSFSTVRTGYVYCMQFVRTAEESQRQALFDAHREWGDWLRVPASLPHTNDRTPGRRLRVGYVSADFRAHSVAFFWENLLEHHDRSAVEVFCYANMLAGDGLTDRFSKRADHWVPVAHLPDQLLARRVREDAIDILVDLHGHTSGSRLAAFALKPAPVQVSYLGYPDTTGLRAIDYRLTDAWVDPPGPLPGMRPDAPDCYYTEKLVRLPETFLCYLPLAGAPAVKLLEGAGEAGARSVTFGSFNTLPKISPAVIGLWASVLGQVPGSRMVIKALGLQDQELCEGLIARFAKEGIEAGRLTLMGQTQTIEAHLALYGEVDIALDTYPYHGTTTTCEALWMGVPVISLAAPAGGPHASRVGVSILNNVGLADLIAGSTEEYAGKAVALANDFARRAALRNGLRERMRASPLMNGPAFARHVEEAYREMWKTWCRST